MNININTITELRELCNEIGVTLEVTPMYRNGYLSVTFESHLDILLVEFSPERESAAVRAAVRELKFSGLLGTPFD
jgi:hypothetical protein